jgi:hypothetical protein
MASVVRHRKKPDINDFLGEALSKVRLLSPRKHIYQMPI